MLDFVKESRFDRLGVFRYSREKGTSAYGFCGHVSEEEKGERERIIMEAQKKISEEKMSMMEGAVLEVLVEKEGETCYEARTQFDAPEIDGRVLIKKGRKKLNPGDFCRVRITSSDEYDLFALQA
jgi:ribosomal protein S12 methylthiotransferase